MKRRMTGSCLVTIILFCTISAQNSRTNVRLRNGNESISDDVNSTDSAVLPKKWISQIFSEAQMAFKMDPRENTECGKDFELFKLHLKNYSTWAVKMMESSEWPLAGILSGTVDFMGNYDECLAISSYNIYGRYCLAKVAYHYSDNVQSVALQEPDQRISAWNALTLNDKNPARVDRKKLTFALCVPSSCTPNDLNASLNSLLRTIFKNNGLDVTVNVDPMFCKTQHDLTYPLGFYVAVSSFVTFFLFVICLTVYDAIISDKSDDVESNGTCADEQKRYFLKETSKNFSLLRNFRKLKQYHPKEYAALHFMRAINILFTIYGHRFFYTLSFPSSNAFVKEGFYTSLTIVLTHMNVVIDSFFSISGFLTFQYEFEPMKRGGMIFLFFSILFRWMRMVSVFGVLMLYIIYVFPSTGDGPLWNYEATSEANRCKESWWAGLFAINNIVKTDQLCVTASWYISVDIQLAIIGGILLYILSKNTKIGIIVTIASFIVSIVVTFITAYKNHFYGLGRIFLNTYTEARNNPEFTVLYISPFTRCGPYLFGFMTAYAVNLLNKNEIKFTNNRMICLFSFLSISIGEACSFYGLLFYEIDRKYDRLEHSLYAALNHVIVMSPYAVVGCIYFTSGLGIFLNKILEWKVWIPFGRLSYSVYLINTVIQLYQISSQKEPFTLPSRINLVWWFWGDVIWSYFLGLIVHLFVEAPILNYRALIKKQLLKIFVKSKPEEQNQNHQMKTSCT
ncbi:nose resistant to fluoxetine protein 6-like isoform X1 [Planococcus citri]|uniref:nose resistant to fluoxetine protein 6-like isoform X1 n=1 Tax=Planococcus citri TaxID=170843 RepID=UPI0031F78FE5